jgi:hypothetical protein
MKFMSTIIKTFALMTALFGLACGSSNDVDEALELVDEDVIDAADLPRRPVDYSRMGVNSFGNDPAFGTPEQQFLEVKQTLGLSYLRLLFAWNDSVQPRPNTAPNFAFYDDLEQALPEGTDALVVLTGLPSWMIEQSNWLEGNPRTTFVERWVRRVVRRYQGNARIIGWQIWNEPNTSNNPDNVLLELPASAANYVEMLARAHSVIRDIAPGKTVVNAATTAINQNYPDTLNYNRAMRDAGAQNFTDVWAMHYYGTQYENVVRSNGVADFLNGLGGVVWVTESGRQGLTNQLAYVEETWPFLREKIPGIARIYYYQHTEAVSAETTYGLRNIERVSDLFIALRDR